jgi:tryptophan-rich sensory protein
LSAAASTLAAATPTWRRVTGVFGLAWIVLFAVGGIALQGEPLAYDAPVSEARDFFAAHGERYLWGDYIAGLGFVLCLLPFVVGLRSLLGAAEGGPQIASRLVLVGGVATVIVGDAATAFLDALAVGNTPAELPDSTIRLLLVLDAVAIAAIGLPMALTAISAATVIWRTGVLPRWLAPLAATSGLLSIVGATFVAADDAEGPLFFMRFAGLITFGVFVAATSVHLISRPAANSLGRDGG